MEAVARASARSAARVHLKLRRGLSSLASIVATAPFVGLFGTVVGIANVYAGSGSGQKWTLFAALTGGISDSLILTSLGLAVAIVASWIYSYLSSELETLDLEMQSVCLQLLNQLVLYRPRPHPR